MPPTETVVGVFAHVDTTVKALEALRARGYHDLEVYTPAPMHEIESGVVRSMVSQQLHQNAARVIDEIAEALRD